MQVDQLVWHDRRSRKTNSFQHIYNVIVKYWLNNTCNNGTVVVMVQLVQTMVCLY